MFVTAACKDKFSKGDDFLTCFLWAHHTSKQFNLKKSRICALVFDSFLDVSNIGCALATAPSSANALR
jgi:hypothetical protein